MQRFNALLSSFVILVLVQTAYAAEHADYYPRPIPMGVSISTTPTLPFISAGTAGMRVYSLNNPQLKFILSNNHVLGSTGPTLCPDTADGWPPPLTWVLQPGTLDIGSDPGNDPFYLAAAVAGAVPMNFSGINLVDAAIAFTTPELASTEILGIGQPNPALGQPTLGMALIKSGRTSGVTTGSVIAVNATVSVDYGAGCGSAWFVGQTMTSAGLGTSGDSGSVVLDSTTLTPVGLYFAGSAFSGVMNPIILVYLSLGVFVDSELPPAILSQQQLQSQAKAISMDPEIEKLKVIQARHEKSVVGAADGVVGFGIGRNADSQRAEFVVFCEKRTAAVKSAIPKTIEGIPVRIVESGHIVAH